MHIESFIAKVPWKLVFAVTFFIYLSGIIAAWLNPATGAEINIYASTPAYFWFALIVTYIVGIIVILLYAAHRINSKFYRNLGILLMVLGATALIGLVNIRGYYVMNLTSDMGGHFGAMLDILNYGNFGVLSGNPYPIAHIAYVAYSLLTAVSLREVVNIVPLIGILLFLVGTILLGKKIFSDRKVDTFLVIISLIAPIGTIMIFNLGPLTEAAPNPFGYYIIPLLLYLLLKCCDDISSLTIIPTGVLLFFVTFVHPMTGFVIVPFIISLLAVNVLGIRINKNPLPLRSTENERLLILLGVCIFAFIIWHFALRVGTIASVFSSLLAAAGLDNNGMSASLLSTMDSAGSYGYGLSYYLRMGLLPAIMWGSIPLAGLSYLIRKGFHKQSGNRLAALVIFTCILILLTGITMVGFAYMNGGRFMSILSMTGILCCAYICSLIFHAKIIRRTDVVKVGTVVLIIALMVVSIFWYYPSPYNLAESRQNTAAELQTLETLIPVMDLDNERYGVGYTAFGRFRNYLYGYYMVPTERQGVSYYVSENSKSYDDPALFHFGYDTADKYGDEIAENTYLFLAKKNIKYYESYFPEMGLDRYSPTDYAHLSADTTVSKFYENGQISVCEVIPSSKQWL